MMIKFSKGINIVSTYSPKTRVASSLTRRIRIVFRPMCARIIAAIPLGEIIFFIELLIRRDHVLKQEKILEREYSLRNGYLWRAKRM